jgi:hypothetical protein
MVLLCLIRQRMDRPCVAAHPCIACGAYFFVKGAGEEEAEKAMTRGSITREKSGGHSARIIIAG